MCAAIAPTATVAGTVAFINTPDELREFVGVPNEGTIRKVRPAFDQHVRAYIAKSPFLVLATTGSDGTVDVSPRGDGPGFVKVLDDRTLAIPERPGNRRVDSLMNVVETGGVGLLFMVPTMEETLRVNGRGRVVREAPFFDEMIVRGKRPHMALVVEAKEVYFHCAKAFKRSKLWEPDGWADASDLPTLGQIMKDQLALPESVVELDCWLEEAYQQTLY